MHCAVKNGHEAVVRLLLGKGADIDARDDFKAIRYTGILTTSNRTDYYRWKALTVPDQRFNRLFQPTIENAPNKATTVVAFDVAVFTQ
jgi:ankyrin repeat protein